MAGSKITRQTDGELNGQLENNWPKAWTRMDSLKVGIENNSPREV